MSLSNIAQLLSAQQPVTALSNTLVDARSQVNMGLTGLVNSAQPNVNSIPGINSFASSGTLSAQNPVTQIGDGVGQVFNAVGIPQNTPVAQTNPLIYQNGVNAATNVWSSINAGGQSTSSIVANNQEALALLKNTNDLLPQQQSVSAPILPTNQYTPYAMDLFALAPKHKFLFVVQFIFNDGYTNIGQGPNRQNQFAVVVQEFDRPKIKYDYEDHVNYYNMRTKVIKRVLHDPLTIRMLDDRKNLSMKFIYEYLAATHPISSVAPTSANQYEQNGMNFNSPLNSSSTGQLTGTLASTMSEIRVYHVYDFGAYMNVYHFTNPKILSMEMDNWAMHESEGSHITAQFGYDALFVEPAIAITSTQNETIQTLSNAGMYPMTPQQVPVKQKSGSSPNLTAGDNAISNTLSNGIGTISDNGFNPTFNSSAIV